MSLTLSRSARRFFWTHPEWWSLGLAALAWAALLALHALPQAAAPGAALDHAHMHRAALDHTQMPRAVSLLAELLSWCLMVVAMMVPLRLEALRWIAFRSFRHRRHRAMLVFLIGFLAPWVLLGGAAAWLRTFAWSQSPPLVSGAFALAALWMPARTRKRALAACHRTVPLATTGWRADRDSLRYGVLLGAPCVATCGPLMLACALSGHSPVAMLGGMALGLLERRSFRAPTRRLVAGALLLAAWFLLPAGSAAFS